MDWSSAVVKFGRSVSNALKEPQDPFKVYMDERYPNKRGLQSEFKKAAGTIVHDGFICGDSYLAGHGIDYLTRLALGGEDVFDVSERGADRSGLDEDAVRGLYEVIDSCNLAQFPDVYSDDFLRAVWAMALLEDLARCGRPHASLESAMALGGASQLSSLLGSAPADGLRLIDELYKDSLKLFVAENRNAREIISGPTFDGSLLLNGDADLIIDEVLWDIKSTAGSPSRGTRKISLSAHDLYQILAYALFDFSDHYSIRAVGIYAPRYSYMKKWELDSLLSILLGQDTNIQIERSMMKDALEKRHELRLSAL